jgi:hypothetical protein
MPLKLNVGLSKKVGLPNYGSLGAICHIEFELDSALLQHDLETFHRHVQNAYVACAQAVNDELARLNRRGNSPPGQAAQGSVPVASPANGPGGNGAGGNGAGNTDAGFNGGTGRSPNVGGSRAPRPGVSHASGRKATPAQVRTINAIAERQGFDLVDLLVRRFSTDRLEELSIGDASALITELKAPSGPGGCR